MIEVELALSEQFIGISTSKVTFAGGCNATEAQVIDPRD